jgi:hypothetical protein
MTNTVSASPKKTNKTFNFFIYVFMILIYLELGIPGFSFVDMFGIYGASVEDGRANSARMMDAIEAYSLAEGQYPHNSDELFYLHYLEVPGPQPNQYYRYEYEHYPSEEDRAEYMLSYRVKWGIYEWDCYYSGDGKWVRANFTCWSGSRPERPSSD